MENTKHHLSFKTIFLFWVPLASTWLMMAIEGPFVAAIIARLAEPKYNLAAFGISFSFALIIEAPIIMLMSASTALVKDKLTYRKLFRFTLLLNFLITGLMLILIIPPVFNFFTVTLMGLPDKVNHLTYYSTILLLPWPAAIGFRRFYQGILIRNNQTRKVAYGTITRLIAMAGSSCALFLWSGIPGAHVGSTSLSIAVIAEAIAIRFMARNILRQVSVTEMKSTGKLLTYRQIVTFYTPLALTSILSLGIHPVVTFFLGKSRMALESLAVIPVVSSFLFLFRSFGFSYLEVVIALVGKKFQYYRSIRNFALLIGISTMGMAIVIALTPLITIWYHTISGLSIELTDFAIYPTIIMAVLPFIELWLAFQRGLQVSGKVTNPLTTATVIELLITIIVLFIGISLLDITGALVAASSFVIGRSLAMFYLIIPNYSLVYGIKRVPLTSL